MTFGETLKQLRKKSNLTIEELAKEIGISKQSIIDYESDTTFPKIDILKKISHHFNVSLDYLVYGENRMMINSVEEGNIKSALIALGTMLNNSLLEIKTPINNSSPAILSTKNNIIKCYLFDYLKLSSKIDGFCTREEKEKIMLLLTEKY